MATQLSIEDLFHAARAKGSEEERERYLVEMCAGDAGLRGRVEALLRAEAESAFFPGLATAEVPDGADVAEGVGSVIGRYKLLQLIGEGGFGLVFMAEQREPVVRRVALKVIKLGMDTRQVIARFEAERQALAMMDHPNIARVIDAGATATGRPYFVMELVQGEPITAFCDARHLSIRERLGLFEQVCQAVQHAHGKGIIHRDIKPNNVLVSERDGRYVARVIDFGIAKAVSTRLTDKTLFTAHGGYVGTPAYMSPEQAGAAVDVDTRTDVYSLGVLLYELLTGTTPFEGKTLRAAAMGEMARIIREVDPPAPSTRISQNRETLAGVAASRKVEPGKLGVLVRGDLDWVVMKALEKDRGRRYATANDLGADVLRHMRDEVVTATPPGRMYRLTKMARRNKLAVGAALAVNLAIVAGLAASSAMFVRERAARAEAVAALAVADRARANEAAQRQVAEEQRRLAEAQRQRAEANYDRARGAVDEVTGIAERQLADRPEVSQVRREMLESAATMYEKILTMEGDNRTVIMETANAYMRAANLRDSVGQGEQARRQTLRAIELVDGVLARAPGDVEFMSRKAELLDALQNTLTYSICDFQAAIATGTAARELYERLGAIDPGNARYGREATWVVNRMSGTYRMAGQWAASAAAAEEALAGDRAASATDEIAGARLHEYEQEAGSARLVMGKFPEAEAHYRTALELRRDYMRRNPDNDYSYFLVAQSLSFLGGTIAYEGRVDEGIEMTRAAVATYDFPVKRHPQYVQEYRAQGYTYEALGNLLRMAGKTEESRAAYLQAKRIAKEIYERNPDEVACSREYLPVLTICEDETICEPAAGVAVGKKLVALAPHAKPYRLWLAAGQLEAGDAKGAVEMLRAASEMEPKGLQWAGPVLAMALHETGDEKGAREVLKEADAWAAASPPRWREPRRFAEQAHRVMGGNAASQP